MKSFRLNIKFFISAIIAVILTAAAVFVFVSMTNKVKRNLTIEAGNAVPKADMFFNDPAADCGFVTDISKIDTSKLGKTKIELTSGGKIYFSSLTVSDTVPPTATPVERFIFMGNTLSPEELAADVNDATAVVFSFASPPDFDRPGSQEVEILLTDGGGNTSKLKSKFYIFGLRENVTIEAGKDAALPAVSEFLTNYNGSPAVEIEFMEETAFDSVKTVPVKLKCGGYDIKTSLHITDTTPPEGVPAFKYIFTGSDLQASELVTDISDATKVACSFVAAPDLNAPGLREVEILITDEGGNTSRVNSGFYAYELKEKVTFEAGSVDRSLTAADFLLNFNHESEISLELPDDLDFSSVGIYEVVVRSGGFSSTSVLEIADTVPPRGSGIEKFAFLGVELSPQSLVWGARDATRVNCSFLTDPDFNRPGWQEVEILITDEGGNSTVVKSKIYVLELRKEITLEAGHSVESNILCKYFAANYIEIPGLSLSMITQGVDFKLPGSYEVVINSGSSTAAVTLNIADTTPPAASVKNQWTYKGKPISADSFFTGIKDASQVTASFAAAPDFSRQGAVTVGLVLTDSYGNRSEYRAVLTVVVDTEPPKITGNINKSAVVGGTISYKSGVTVSDDYDKNVTLTVDSSKVNLKAAGTYTVVYSATDESGNKTTVEGIITVSKIDMTLVNGMADDILASIIKPGMSDRQKAYAIFMWVHNKMSYRADSSVHDIAQRAYNCFTKGTGDCYTYMSASQVLLNRVGIENLEVQRYGGETPHHWNLVNLGDGWFHFDVCPTPSNKVKIEERFMFGEDKAEQYTLRIGRSYYVYDKSTVPEVEK